MFIALIVLAVLAVIYAIGKHITLAQIETELQKLEAAGVADAKTVIAAVRAKI